MRSDASLQLSLTSPSQSPAWYTQRPDLKGAPRCKRVRACVCCCGRCGYWYAALGRGEPWALCGYKYLWVQWPLARLAQATATVHIRQLATGCGEASKRAMTVHRWFRRSVCRAPTSRLWQWLAGVTLVSAATRPSPKSLIDYHCLRLDQTWMGAKHFRPCAAEAAAKSCRHRPPRDRLCVRVSCCGQMLPAAAMRFAVLGWGKRCRPVRLTASTKSSLVGPWTG